MIHSPTWAWISGYGSISARPCGSRYGQPCRWSAAAKVLRSPSPVQDDDDWIEGIEPVQRAGRELLSVEVVATSLASTLYSADPTTQHDHDNQ